MSCGRIFRGGHTDCVFDVAWGTDARSNGALLAWRPSLRIGVVIFPTARGGSMCCFLLTCFFFFGGGCFNFPESLCIFSLLGGRVTCPFRRLKNNISVMPARNIEENPTRMTTENRRSIQFLTSWTFGPENFPQIIRMFFPPKNGEI